MLQWGLTVLYCSLIFIWIWRSRPVSELHPQWPFAAFAFKILLGFANYYIWINILEHGDSLRYMHDSLVVYNSLFDDPLTYVQLIFRTSLENVPEQLIPYQKALFIEWHVPEYHMVRLLAILNLFTAGSAWGNIVLLSFLIFLAQLFLFRSLKHIIGENKMTIRVAYAILFFLPSTIFWSSGLLKEGPVLALLSLLAGCTIRLMGKVQKADLLKYVTIILITLFVLFLVRDYVAILCLFNGAILLLIAHHKRPFIYAMVLTIVLATGVSILAQTFSNGFLDHLKTEQTYFLLSGTDPDYTFQTLDGTFRDLIGKIPYVINNVLFRPNILHSSTLFRIYQSIELLLSWSLILWLLLRNRKHIRLSPAGIAVMLLCIELLFLFGLMVTDADTLSRYRSVPVMGLLLLSFLGARKPSETVIN